MKTQFSLQVERECRAVALALFRYLDDHDAAAAAGLFNSTATWERQGRVLRGPSEIKEALAQRPATRRTAHVITNETVTPMGANLTQVRYLLSAYESIVGENSLRLVGIRSCTDELIFESGKWYIASKRSKKLLPAE